MAVRFRPMPQTEPGSGFYLTTDIMTYLNNRGMFLTETGLSADDVLSTPIVPLPIPLYTEMRSPQRWKVNVEMLWHPLFWLPERLRYPHVIEDSSGNTREETRDEYALRVFLELAGAGAEKIESRGAYYVHVDENDGIPLYPWANEDGVPITPDELYPLPRLMRLAHAGDSHVISPFNVADGTWLDVPALVGIDLATPEGRDRMQAWVDGACDPLLDSLDLDQVLVTEDRDANWASNHLYRGVDLSELGVTEHHTFADIIVGAAHAVHAWDMLDLVENNRLPFDYCRAMAADIFSWGSQTPTNIDEYCSRLQSYASSWDRYIDLHEETVQALRVAILMNLDS